MSNLSTAMSLVLAAGMLVAALLSIVTRSLPLAILSAGGGSLLCSPMVTPPAAPGAAATAGAARSRPPTFLFFFVLGRVGGKGHG